MKIFIITILMLTITVLPALGEATDDFANLGVNASAFRNLSTALTSPRTIGKAVVVSEPMTINTKTTDRTIIVTAGGNINVASGKTLNINGAFSAGLHYVFAGKGRVQGLKEARPEWFGSDASAVTKAISSAPVVRFTDFTITSPITVASPVTLIGGKVTQTTLNSNAFIVTADNVTFDGMEIIGNNGNHTASETTQIIADKSTLSTKMCGIFADGSSTTQRKSLRIINSRIHGFNFAVRALWQDGFVLDNCKIYNCFTGVYGGAGWQGSIQNDQNVRSQSYSIINSDITVEYGPREYARPITLPLNGGRAFISGNRLRGGGMAFENTLSADAVANITHKDKRIIVVNNDLDTSISIADIISGNIIDANLAPANRGPQYGPGSEAGHEFYQAIEPLGHAIITGNIVRNYAIAIANLGAFGPTISGNVFDTIGTSLTPMPGVIAFANNNPSDINSGTIISNNKFINIGNMPILNLQWGAPHNYILSNIIFDSNIIMGADSYGMLLRNVKDLRVTNNTAIDCNRLQNGYSSFFIWEDSTSYVEAYYSGNSISRTLKTGYGTSSAFANNADSVFGFNSFSGLRSIPLLNPAAAKYASPIQRVNGTVVHLP